ncbi:MAG: carbohydrate kinase family protein [Acidimicrobiia bacterium]
MAPAEVVVLGAAGLDTTVAVDGLDLETGESRFTSVVDGVGQAGGYAARIYAAAGRTVSFVGGIGADLAGEELRRVLEIEGVDTSPSFPEPLGTARSVNLALPDGRRRSFYDGRLGNGRPDSGLVGRLLARARLIHVNLPGWVRPLLPMARSSGAVVACDLQDLPSPDDSYRSEFVRAADILFFSAADLGEPDRAVRRLWERNPDALVVAGLGGYGALLGLAGRITRHPAPEVDLPVVDTTGAGDSLAAGFLVAHVLQGRTPEEALARGQVTARHTCSLRQPKAGFADPGTIEALLTAAAARS